MNLETDLNTIFRIAEEKEEENRKFRTYLKNLDIKRSKLDSIVQKITAEVTPQIDCTECANCCKGLSPMIEEDDINLISSHLEITSEVFKEKHIIVDEEGDYTFNTNPCPFLKENLCTVYECRPQTCHSYPHLNKSGFVFRLLGVLQNYQYCPIVFNVFNRLKEELINE